MVGSIIWLMEQSLNVNSAQKAAAAHFTSTCKPSVYQDTRLH